MGVRKQRKAAMLAIANEVSDKQAERAIKGYIELLETTIDAAFNLIASDNTYSEKINKAYELLGDVLNKASSKDVPFGE